MPLRPSPPLRARSAHAMLPRRIQAMEVIECRLIILMC